MRRADRSPAGTARRRQPLGDVEAPPCPGEKKPARAADDPGTRRFLAVLAAGLLIMLACLGYAAWEPQSKQHAWLSTQTLKEVDVAVERAKAAAAAEAAERAVAEAAEAARYLARPLQQEPGLPPGAEVAAPEAEKGTVTKIRCASTAGPLDLEVYEGWAPLGAKRFLEMVTEGFFSSRVGLFRAVKNFLCQTGVPGDPAVHRAWRARGRVPDDPQWLDMKGTRRPLKRGYLAFAGSGPNSRTTEFFFAFRDLQLGGSPWEVPFGKLVGEASYAALDRFYSGYGDMKAFGGSAPAQGQIYARGAAYLDAEFPLLDFITRCDVVDNFT